MQLLIRSNWLAVGMWRVCVLWFVCCCGCLCGAHQLSEVVERGRAQLSRLQRLASQPGYGDCWLRALERVHNTCQRFTEETQSQIALAFTHCHLTRSGRPFPECPEKSDIRECTHSMDAVAFNTYTEFFTHAHSICHFLESERWQHRAENTIHRLTESSAGVAEQLASTQRMAENLVEAQSAALRSQEAILKNGEELKVTLHESTQGVKEVFSEIRDSALEQQVAFSEIFNRVAFLQSFIMSESHTLGSLLYNTLALCTAFLLTSTRRTAGARLVLFALVAVNVYLERVIYQNVLESTALGYQQMEQIEYLVGLLRRTMVLLGLLVLVYMAVRFRDVSLESLEILNQLKQSQSNLQLALEKAEYLSSVAGGMQVGRRGKCESVVAERWRRKTENEDGSVMFQELSVIMPNNSPQPSPSVLEEPTVSISQDTLMAEGTVMEIPKRSSLSRPPRSRRRQSSTLVYSVLVEEQQPRYNLRNRRSLPAPAEQKDLW